MNKQRFGFTLSEMLIATMLMAIVLTGAYTMFSNVLLQWRTGSENESTYTDARLIFTLLERDLGAIPSDANSVDTRAFFLGEVDTLEFITVIEGMPSEDAQYPRLMLVRYYLDKRSLVREEAALLSSLPAELSETGRFDRYLMEFDTPIETIVSSGVKEWYLNYNWTPVDEESAIGSMFSSRSVEYGLPNRVDVSVQLLDKSQTGTLTSTSFSKSIWLKGTASEIPAYAQLSMSEYY